MANEKCSSLEKSTAWHLHFSYLYFRTFQMRFTLDFVECFKVLLLAHQTPVLEQAGIRRPTRYVRCLGWCLGLEGWVQGKDRPLQIRNLSRAWFWPDLCRGHENSSIDRQEVVLVQKTCPIPIMTKIPGQAFDFVMNGPKRMVIWQVCFYLKGRWFSVY